MTAQQTLAGFTEKTVSISEAVPDFRPWNRVILDWDIDYRGYQRDSGGEGYLDFQVRIAIKEALVPIKDVQSRRAKEVPGYSLTVFQSVAFNGHELDSQVVYEVHVRMDELNKAYDAFQQELLNVQSWVEIAESRARIMPQQNEVFECLQCGWVTDIWSDDITCQGCGRRYWSEKMWARITEEHPAPCSPTKHGA